MKWLLYLAGLTLVMAAGTWWGGWWMVPVAAALFGAWRAHARDATLTAMLAAACAWSALLLFDASRGPVGRLTHLFGAIFHMSDATLLILTVAYAALLAATAAACARGIRRLVTPA
jgi:hypothetical protein